MTNPTDPCEGIELCGAPHPTEQLVCIRPPGTNNFDRDNCQNVHVHYGTTGEGLSIAGWSWQDVSE